MGCCLIALLVAGAPRIALVAWWLFDPTRFSTTFSTWILPVLGFLILPWTTVAYLFVAPGGLTTLDWVILGVALLADLGSHGGGGRAYRQRRSE